MATRIMQVIDKTTRRSDCPINFSLEILGDTWSLLILRDIIYFGKRTYNEFLASEEHIAPNILAARLKQLQDKGLLIKKPHPHDKRKEIYELTEDGVDVIPVLVELANWGAPQVPKESLPQEWFSVVKTRREEVLRLTREVVSQGGSIFIGDGSAVQRLGLR